MFFPVKTRRNSRWVPLWSVKIWLNPIWLQIRKVRRLEKRTSNVFNAPSCDAKHGSSWISDSFASHGSMFDWPGSFDCEAVPVISHTCCSDFKTRKDLGKKPGMVEKSEQLLFLIDVDIKRNRTKQLGTLAASCEQTCDDWVGAISFAIFGWYVYFLAGEVKRWRMINDRPEERRTYIFTSSPNHNKQQLLCLQQATSSHCWCKLNLVSIIIFVPSSWQDHAVVSQI